MFKKAKRRPGEGYIVNFPPLLDTNHNGLNHPRVILASTVLRIGQDGLKFRTVVDM